MECAVSPPSAMGVLVPDMRMHSAGPLVGFGETMVMVVVVVVGSCKGDCMVGDVVVGDVVVKASERAGGVCTWPWGCRGGR